MDAKHRHELQENELADWLGSTIEHTKPYLPAIIAAVVALVVGVVAWGAYSGSRTQSNAEAWRLYSDAMVGGMPTPALLEQAADEATGTAVADWAALTLADSELWQASETFFTDSERAKQSIERAEPLYKNLVGASDPWVSGRAKFGLARAAEIAGDTEGAIKLYGRVTGALAPLAKQRAEQLAKPKTEEAIAWLAESQVALPGVGGASEAPASSGGPLSPDDVLLPAPEGGLPSLDEMLKKAEQAAAEDEPAGDSNAPANETPNDSEADTTPADE